MAEKQFYPIVVLIIASDDPVYKEMKRISMQYYSRFADRIKFFYLYCKPESESNETDLCFSDYDESLYPGIFYKTAKAIQYIENNFDYELLVRTNLSTFWNMNNLLSHMQILIDSYSDAGYAGGPLRTFYIKNDFIDSDFTFIDGYGIILAKDVVNNIFVINDPFANNYYKSANDDLCISKLLLENGYNLKEIENFTIKQLIDNNTYDEGVLNNIPQEEFNKILAFRIKNPDRNLDIQYMNQLYQKLYT